MATPQLLNCEDLRVRAGSKHWLEARRNGIGASEIAAALGLSPYSSPTDLYYRKLGVLPDERDNAQMEWGRELESTILKRFLKCHPEFRGTRPLVGRLYRSTAEGRGWQLATPDGVVFDQRMPFHNDKVRRLALYGVPTIVQVKTASSKEEWGQERSDEIPLHYRCQVMQEMDVVGARVAWLPVLFNGRDYREYRVEFNEHDAQILRARGRDFWRRVESRTPPPTDAHRATAKALRDAFGYDPEQQAQVPRDLVEKIARAKALGKRLDALEARYEARLRECLGDATTGLCGTAVVAKRSTFTSRRFDSTAFRQDHPDLADKYTKPLPMGRLTFTTKEIA